MTDGAIKTLCLEPGREIPVLADPDVLVAGGGMECFGADPMRLGAWL